MPTVFESDRKKVVCFDLNGTLIDPRAGFMSAVEHNLGEFTARWDGSGWKPREAALAYERAWQKGNGARQRGTRTNSRTRSLEQRQLSCLYEALAGSPMEATESFLRLLLGQIRESAPSLSRAYPDVPHVLERLARSYTLAVISNSSRYTVETAIESAGLSDWFAPKHIFTPDAQTPKKPHPDMFRKAVHRMGVRPAEAVMVGNSWRTDISGACHAGLDAVWIRTQRTNWSKRQVGACIVVRAARFLHLRTLFS